MPEALVSMGLNWLRYFESGLRLGIQRVELAHAAGQQQVDHRDVALRGRGRLRAQTQNVALTPEAEQAQ